MSSEGRRDRSTVSETEHPERSARLEDRVGEPLADLALPDTEGNPYPLRQHVGNGPSVLFFVIRSGTPG